MTDAEARVLGFGVNEYGSKEGVGPTICFCVVGLTCAAAIFTNVPRHWTAFVSPFFYRRRGRSLPISICWFPFSLTALQRGAYPHQESISEPELCSRVGISTKIEPF